MFRLKKLMQKKHTTTKMSQKRLPKGLPNRSKTPPETSLEKRPKNERKSGGKKPVLVSEREARQQFKLHPKISPCLKIFPPSQSIRRSDHSQAH